MQPGSKSGSVIFDALFDVIDETAAREDQVVWGARSNELKALLRHALTSSGQPKFELGQPVTPQQAKYEQRIKAAIAPCVAPPAGSQQTSKSGRAPPVLQTPGDKSAEQERAEGLRTACQQVQSSLEASSGEPVTADELLQVLDYVAQMQRSKAGHSY